MNADVVVGTVLVAVPALAGLYALGAILHERWTR